MSHPFLIRERPASVVVEAAGELDAYVAPDLGRVLEQALEIRSDLPLVLDLTRVEFLDSTALGILVGAYRRASARGRGLSILLPAGHARRIFAHTQLDQVLPLVEPER